MQDPLTSSFRWGETFDTAPQNRLRSGEDGRTHRSAPTEIGVTAFDGWICRVDVIRVGADLRVRPQNRLRSGEDRRTHRSAPYKELHVIKDLLLSDKSQKGHTEGAQPQN